MGFKKTLKEVVVDNRKSFSFPGQFSHFSLFMSGNTDYFNRNYLKLQTIVANIGGIIKFVSVISNFIVAFFTSKLFFLQIFYGGEERKEMPKQLQKVEITTNNNILTQNYIRDFNFRIEDLSKLDLTTNNMKTGNRITKTEEVKLIKQESIKLNWRELIFPVFCLKAKSKEKFINLEKIINIIKKNLSIEEIFAKLQKMPMLEAELEKLYSQTNLKLEENERTIKVQKNNENI